MKAKLMPHLYTVMLIDAFTDTRLQGNPCMVVLSADNLTAEQMQAIAREANQSETAFIMHSAVADFRARYFTPAEEIPLAGHPTMAVTRALLDIGQVGLEVDSFTLELQAGVIEVSLEHDARNSTFTMTQKKPEFTRIYDAETVAPVFGLSPDDLMPDVPLQTVSTGTPQLMIPVRDHDALRQAQMDFSAYVALREAGDFFSPHLFCLGGATEDGDTFARHFGVPPDTREDPFTGSATGGMGAYLWHYGLIETPRFIAQQGHWMNRAGQALVEVVGKPNDIETVKVSGQAITTILGTLSI
jgi:trans-2,3-dihydro-3-hydroxyanthranilate isomerase